jgi:hypothetical protein
MLKKFGRAGEHSEETMAKLKARCKTSEEHN